MNWFYFALAAGLGGFIRYALEHKTVGKTGFPRATLIVNVAGSFLLGLVFAAPESYYQIIGIAFCGALTTFSGISAQLMRRVNSKAFSAALNFLALTLVLGLTAAEIGLLIGTLVFH